MGMRFPSTAPITYDISFNALNFAAILFKVDANCFSIINGFKCLSIALQNSLIMIEAIFS